MTNQTAQQWIDANPRGKATVAPTNLQLQEMGTLYIVAAVAYRDNPNPQTKLSLKVAERNFSYIKKVSFDLDPIYSSKAWLDANPVGHETTAPDWMQVSNAIILRDVAQAKFNRNPSVANRTALDKAKSNARRIKAAALCSA